MTEDSNVSLEIVVLLLQISGEERRCYIRQSNDQTHKVHVNAIGHLGIKRSKSVPKRGLEQ